MKPILMRTLTALLLVIVLLLNTTAAFALEKQAADSQGQYTIKDGRDYPIIFIPGMAGSTLDIGGGENAWPGSFSDEDLASMGNWPLTTAIQYLVTGKLGIKNDEAFKVLALKNDGKSPLSGPQVMPADTVRYGAGDVYGIAGYKITGDFRMAPIYQGFYDYMETQGYKLNENPDTGKVFFHFPYDFRQDNRNWTKLLDKKVDEVRKETGADKVILVGHSMGGLQARLYMKDAGRAAKVAAVIFMGTPHHGSPMAFYSFTEGYNFGNLKLTDARMWEIAANWAGGYQLMPDYPFILDGDDLSKPPVGIEAMLHENWITAQEYARYLDAQNEGKKYKIDKGFPNDKFAADSIKFHEELGDSVDKYPGVKYYMIRGTAQDTVEYLVGKKTFIQGLPEGLLTFTRQLSPSKQGDGTVPLMGAQVKGLDKEYEVNSEHGAIPSNGDAQAILTDIRKDVNNEEFRQELVDKVTVMAGVKLAEFGRGGFSETKFNLWEYLGLLIMRGQQDEEKQDLKKEIRNLAASVIRNCRVNITINSAADPANKELVEHLYLVIDDFKIKDSGTGIVSGANVNVIVDSYSTFEKVTKNRDDVTALVAAYKSGAITVKGGGFTNMLIARLLEWFRKYM